MAPSPSPWPPGTRPWSAASCSARRLGRPALGGRVPRRGPLAEPALALRRLLGVPTAGSGPARLLLLATTVADGGSLSAEAARDLYRGSLRSNVVGSAVASVAAADLTDDLRRIQHPSP